MTATHLTRRGLLGAALAIGGAAPIGLAGRASAATGPVRLTLPPPAGPYPVGTVSLHLVDRSRLDPLAGPGRHRELMARVWYPAAVGAGRYPRAPWLPAAAMRALLESGEFDGDAALAPLTAGREGAPVRRTTGRLPVIVYSHGAHGHQAENTIVVQELASHGYAVVTVAHTYDAFSVFPGGRLTVPFLGDEHSLGAPDFAADIPFILDCIEALAAGRNPDAGHRALPAGLRGALDPRRIGMFGWSKGGTATALVMRDDHRVRAGLSLDAPLEPIIETDQARPFLLMTAEFTRAEFPVAEFWSHLTGWRRNLQVEGALHSSLGDYQVLVPQLAPAVGMSDEELREDWIGTLAPARSVRIQRAYPLAFFDRHLRGRGHLLDGPSPAFPEVTFVP
jgi:hypothetical protein